MTQSKLRSVRTSTGIAGLTLIALCTLAGPAAARQDAGPPTPRVDVTSRTLARVGTQYVVGDNLTGNGVPAPAWIPEL